MGQWIKIIFINFAVLVGLLFSLNIGSALVVKYHNQVEKWLTPKPSENTVVMMPGQTFAENPINTNHMNRWKLPNYAENRERAYAFFTEFEQIESEYRSFVGWSRAPFAGKATTVNAAGDRVNPETAALSPEELAKRPVIVRFFGGSTMWGLGAADEGTIPAQFEKIAPITQAHNHGEASFNSRQNLARLVNLFSAGEKANYIVFYNGHNHLSTACGEGRTFNRGTESFMHHYREEQIQTMVRNGSAYGNLLAGTFWQYTAQLIPQVIYRLNPALADSQTTQWDVDPKKSGEECADILINNWRMAHAIAEENKVKFIGILQPTSSVGSPRLDHLMPEVLTPPKKSQRYQEFYAAMREKMKAYDYMVDMSDAFDGNDYIYVDSVHVSANGNAMIAQKIKDALFPPQPPLEEKDLQPVDKPGEVLPNTIPPGGTEPPQNKQAVSKKSAPYIKLTPSSR